MVAIVLRYDLRSPEWAATKHPELYSTCLEQVSWAESTGAADLIARGRVSFVVGLGYAQHEFDMAGIDRKRRAPMTEEYIQVMRKAWTGEPFEWQGRTVRVTPKPFSQPHPPIFMGGSTEKSA